jgi:hypothetical protein
MLDGDWQRSLVRFFRSHRDGQGFQAIFAGDAGRAIAQDGMHKISNLRQVSVGEASEKMIRQHLLAAASSQENRGNAVEAADKDRALRTYDLGSNVVTVNGLRVRLNISNRAALVLKIHHAGDHVSVLGYLGTDRAPWCRHGRLDLITHQPARQIEIVNRVGIEQHSVHIGS